MVYVGSNGGALHGFDAVSGEEKLAYYPGALYRTGHGGYHDLALAGFKHKTKYVDGVPSVSDVKVDGKWRTVLVSSLGGGGRGLFALDVTKPSDLSDASKTVLWEFTHEDDPHLGYTHSKPILRQMNNGKWAAIIGNGQGADAADATAGQAQLFIVYLDGPGSDGVWDLGRDYLRISTGKGTSDERNALFSPIGIDRDVTPDGQFDLIYAGDLYGNLWRFDVSGSSASSWSSPVEPFFKGDKTRPITATPAVGIAPAGVTDLAPMRTGALEKTHSVMVFFGSGRLLADADKAASIVNRFYGVYDDGSKIGLTEADLTEQQRTYSTATARVYQNDLEVGYTRSAGSSKRGWYITLPDDGERVIDRALVKGELVYFNTVLPDTSTCDAGGKGWENVVQMANGGSAKGAQWDVNQNGLLDAGDTHAGISFAGRKTAQGQPGAPKIIGNVLFSSRAYKVGAVGKEDECKGLDIPVSCGPLPSDSSSTSGRISWMELQPKQTD
jgi:type IV pilus assembly protein PilY1